MTPDKIISRTEAEKIGMEQVAGQNKIFADLGSSTRYKFIRVGNLNECWEGYEDMEFYKKNRSLLVWRIDGSQFVSDQWDGDEGHWTKTAGTMLNEKSEFWYVVADYEVNGS